MSLTNNWQPFYELNNVEFNSYIQSIFGNKEYFSVDYLNNVVLISLMLFVIDIIIHCLLIVAFMYFSFISFNCNLIYVCEIYLNDFRDG